jgi:hypothetical protein
VYRAASAAKSAVGGKAWPGAASAYSLVEAGLHVLANKPAIIQREDLPRLEAVLGLAAERRLASTFQHLGRGSVVPGLRRDDDWVQDDMARTSLRGTRATHTRISDALCGDALGSYASPAH